MILDTLVQFGGSIGPVGVDRWVGLLFTVGCCLTPLAVGHSAWQPYLTDKERQLVDSIVPEGRYVIMM